MRDREDCSSSLSVPFCISLTLTTSLRYSHSLSPHLLFISFFLSLPSLLYIHTLSLSFSPITSLCIYFLSLSASTPLLASLFLLSLFPSSLSHSLSLPHRHLRVVESWSVSDSVSPLLPHPPLQYLMAVRLDATIISPKPLEAPGSDSDPPPAFVITVVVSLIKDGIQHSDNQHGIWAVSTTVWNLIWNPAS